MRLLCSLADKCTVGNDLQLCILLQYHTIQGMDLYIFDLYMLIDLGIQS